MPDPSRARTAVYRLIETDDAPEVVDKDIFHSLMRAQDLPFLAIALEGKEDPVDIVLFDDGSGFFADSCETGTWTPWPCDAADGIESELLPAWPSAAEHLPFSTPYRFIDESEVASEFFTEHLKTCAQFHHDGPEGLRHLLVEEESEMSWAEVDRVEEVLSTLSNLGGTLCPDAIEVVIFARSTPGKTHVQKVADAGMMELLKGIGPRFADDPTMQFHYQGQAYAEISDTNGNYEDRSFANRIFAPVSRVILDKIGSPVGWETNYNDGPANRLSGYSAFSKSLVLDIASMSTHQRLSARHQVIDFLRRENLIDPLRPLLCQSSAFADLPG